MQFFLYNKYLDEANWECFYKLVCPCIRWFRGSIVCETKLMKMMTLPTAIFWLVPRFDYYVYF